MVYRKAVAGLFSDDTHDARDFIEHHGRGGVEARLGGSLGRGSEHGDRLGADHSGVGGGVGRGLGPNGLARGAVRRSEQRV
jgi:hypothetical protein